MFDFLEKIFIRADLLSVSFTLVTLIIASLKNWFVSEQKLKETYWLMILLGFSYLGLNTNIAMNGNGQDVVLLMNIPAIWTVAMGIKGLRRLKKAKDNASS